MATMRLLSLAKRYGWTGNLLVIFLSAYFLAGTANAVVANSIRTPRSGVLSTVVDAARTPKNKARSIKLETIAERNLLSGKRENLTPTTEVSYQEPEPSLVSGREYSEADLKDCTIPGQVKATLVADTPEWSIAVIYNNSTREAAAYSINDGASSFADDATVVDIRSREVVMRRRDHFELCSIDATAKRAPARRYTPPTDSKLGGGGVTKIGENEFRVDKSEVDNALSNLNKVATQARIVPSFKNGKSNGFKLFSIKPGSIYSKIGMKNGDVIQKINGYELNSPDKALEIYQKLKNASSLAIDFERRGRKKSFSYTIQ